MESTSQRLIRLPEVISKTGYGRASLYRYVARKEFPAPVTLGRKASAWVESEVDAWIAARISARNSAA